MVVAPQSACPSNRTARAQQQVFGSGLCRPVGNNPAWYGKPL